MRDWNDETPLSLREVARELGMEPGRGARRLRRHIKRREEALGREILVPLGTGDGRGIRYGVSIPALVEACPEVIEGQERALERVGKRVGSVEKKIADLEEEVLELRAVLAHLLRPKRASR